MFKNRPRGTIPEPMLNLTSLQTSVLSTKEIVEQLAGQRAQVLTAAVTFGDLVDLGLIKPDQVPNKLVF